MPKQIIHCKLCQDFGPAADAHVIPKAFYEISKNGNDYLDVITSKAWERTSKSRNGFYDQKLLCQKCESRYSSIDHRGIEILLKSNREPYKEGSGIAFDFEIIRDIDPIKLNDFLVFLVWRILASDLDPFKKAINPNIEQKLRELLLTETAGSHANLQVFFQKISHNLPMPKELNLLLNGSVYMSELEDNQILNIGLGDLLLMANLGAHYIQPPLGILAFPDCIHHASGLLIFSSEEHSIRHIQRIQQITTAKASEMKIMDMARRVIKRFPNPKLSPRRIKAKNKL